MWWGRRIRFTGHLQGFSRFRLGGAQSVLLEGAGGQGRNGAFETLERPALLAFLALVN